MLFALVYVHDVFRVDLPAAAEFVVPQSAGDDDNLVFAKEMPEFLECFAE